VSQSFTKSSITLATANKLIAAAESAALNLKLMVAISIVDESGTLKAFSRMDGAPLLAVDISKDKAYTAVSYGIPTHAWFDFIKNDPPLLHGIVQTPRLVIFGGGYPIEIAGSVIGGIGVSGGHYEQDMSVAQAALAVL
jgi:uncharacterized protein GlcG (DUF336 family)